jgi:hypothetical protein
MDFYQFLAVCFELFSSGVIFNSEIADEWAPPIRCHVPCRARLAARRCRVAAMCQRCSRALRPLSGLRAARPDRLVPPARTPHRARRSPDRLAPHATRLTAHAAVPTAAVRSRRRRSVAVPPSRSPIAVVPRRRPSDGEPPRPSAVSRAPVGATVGPPCSTVATCCATVRCALRGPAELGRARCAGRGQAGPSPRGRGPCQRREHGSHPVWPWAVRPRCATGPSAVSAQWHSD